MAEDITVCFSSYFKKSLLQHYPKTDLGKFKEYMEKRISDVIEKMNSVENGIRLRKVHFDIDPNSPGISINLDKACRGNCETAYLQVPPEIVKPLISLRTDDLIELLEFKVSGSRIKTDLSCQSLIHEFGHLQDAQTKEFGYTRECKHLHYYIDVIWNVLLEARLFNTYRMSARCKEDNWKDYYSKLKTPGFSPKRKEFECLWQKKDYCYRQIIEVARGYSEASKANHG